MKKIVLVFSLLFLFLLAGCSGSTSMQEIDYNTFKEKIENKDSFVVFIYQTGCSHCEAYEPTLSKVVSDYKLNIYKLNLSSASPSQSAAIKKKVDLKGTPTLIYLEEGKSDIDGSIIGEAEYDTTVDFFKKLGYIEG